MIKSSIRWRVTLGVAAATFLSWGAVENLSAFALPEEEMLKKLDPVPVFTIADEQGTPLVAGGENEEKVAGVFVSLDDAKEFINQLKTENPELADKVRVVPVSLGEVYKLAGSAEGEENTLNFTYVPQQEAVTQAKTISEQNDQPYQGGVPLFVARSGEDKSYLTFERNSQQVIPFFFDKAQLEQMVARLKKQQPEISASVDIEVHSLENVIETLETGSDEMLEKIVLVPFAESIEFLQQNATATPAEENESSEDFKVGYAYLYPFDSDLYCSEYVETVDVRTAIFTWGSPEWDQAVNKATADDCIIKLLPAQQKIEYIILELFPDIALIKYTVDNQEYATVVPTEHLSLSPDYHVKP